MKACVVGTAGHVDHGKTTLVGALTGVDTDRWTEEKERGLTIDLGFAPLHRDDDLEVGLVDVPGHEDFVKNMLAGATGVDVVLLVVAADEGPMPQTREHLTAVHLLGIDRGVIALTKADRVSPEWMELARETVEEEMRTVVGHTGWPIVAVSAVDGTGVEAVREALMAEAREVTPREEDDLFRMPVDRSFSLEGVGTVVTGTTWTGDVGGGDRLRALPADRRVRVRSTQVHGEERARVGAGRRCALGLADVTPEEVRRGTFLTSHARWSPSSSVGARLTVPAHGTRPIEDGQRVRIYHGTRETMARVELTEEVLRPGTRGWARLRLEEPVAVRVRDRFVVRFYSPVSTIGGGTVAWPEAGSSWRERTTEWNRLLGSDQGDALQAALLLSGRAGSSGDQLPLCTGSSERSLRDLCSAPPAEVLEIRGRWFHASALESTQRRLLSELEEIHEGRPRAPAASLESLRAALPASASGALVERALDDLRRSGEVVTDGPDVRRPGHTPTLTESERDAKARLMERLEAGGPNPPRVKRLARVVEGDVDLLHDLLTLLEREDRVVAVSPDLYLARPVEERLRRRARRILEERDGPVPLSDFKDAFGTSRSYLIPLLEHFDRVGMTRRTGEGRVLAADEATGEDPDREEVA